MENQEADEKKEVLIRILQLKNNFYWNNKRAGQEALGKYCVLGHFDALDITKANKAKVTEFDTWKQLGELTVKQESALSYRTLVCVTDQQDDEKFWEDEPQMLYFITMVRLNKNVSVEDKRSKIKNSELLKSVNHIDYLSYDHSEIIVVIKTNTYSEGIENVKLIRKVCEAVKTYTLVAVRESMLQSYHEIEKNLSEENVCCRLHCMVKDYVKAEVFRQKLEKHFTDRNKRTIKIRKFEIFGWCDWLLEVDDVSISSIFECYRMGEMLTHSNEDYMAAFFNIESEILIEEEQNGRELDRSTEGQIGRNIQGM